MPADDVLDRLFLADNLHDYRAEIQEILATYVDGDASAQDAINQIAASLAKGIKEFSDLSAAILAPVAAA